MAGYVVSDSEITSIADAIRTKGGTSAQLEWPGDFVDAIDDIPSGASNVVTGTFTGTAGGSMTVDLPYTGSGFPTSVMIYPKEGAKNSSGTFGSTVWKGATSYWFAAKRNNNAPTYSGTVESNNADGYVNYKSSTSSATSYSAGAINNINIYQNSAAASTSYYTLCRIRSSTKLSVYISGAAGTNGFMKDIEYVYTVTYSS